jgi:hypothetical protein
MESVVLFSLLVGVVLANRFKVFVLVPFSLLGVIAISAVRYFTSEPIGSPLFACALSVMCIQFGYLLGVLIATREGRLALSPRMPNSAPLSPREPS